MGDLTKLRLALGQPEIVEGRAGANELARDRMIDRALDVGADALVLPGSLTDASDIRIIGLNDTRIDVEGSVVVLEAGDHTYRIALGESAPACDFCIRCDVEPYAIAKNAQAGYRNSIVAKPVGIRDLGNKIVAYEGGAAVYDADGNVTTQLSNDFEEDLALVSFEEAGPIERREGSVLDAVVSSMRRFDRLALPWKPAWVIGLSGGLDSSVVAALLAIAFGPERVRSYNLSTRYNSQATKSNASHIADALGITLRSGSIEGQITELGKTIEQFGYDSALLSGLTLENAQARARGNLLSAFSALENGVVANNGNRVECALGYATLYGDAIGALAPIADLTKVQLFDLSRQINERFAAEVIPENLLPTLTEEGYTWKTMPSAELASGQLDPMKWFYHDWLIGQLLGDCSSEDVTVYEAACEVMERYEEDCLKSSEVGKWVSFYGLDDPSAFIADLDWVLSSIQKSAFKRVQAPPKIAMASTKSVRAFAERQIAEEAPSRFHVLRSQILARNMR